MRPEEEDGLCVLADRGNPRAQAQFARLLAIRGASSARVGRGWIGVPWSQPEKAHPCGRTSSRQARPSASRHRRPWQPMPSGGGHCGRSRDHRVGKIDTSERVHLRNFEGMRTSRSGGRPGTPQRGLCRLQAARGKPVMPTGCGCFAGPLGLHLADHICRSRGRLACLWAQSPITSIGSTGGNGSPCCNPRLVGPTFSGRLNRRHLCSARAVVEVATPRVLRPTGGSTRG
jgi:hypothetical protein